MNTTTSLPTSTTNLPTNLTTPGTRTAADSLTSFPSALRSEMIKVTSVRSNGAIIGLTASVSALATWAMASFGSSNLVTTVEVFTFTSIFTAVFAAVAGILMFSSEVQHGTLNPMLAAQPSKAVVVAAKTATAAAFGAVLSIVGMTTAMAGSTVGGLDFGETSGLAGDAGRAVLFTVLASILGLGVGMMARHSAAAISGLLVWWLVVESLLGAFLPDRFSRFLPFAAGDALVDLADGVDEDLVLTLTENALVFGGYAFIAVAMGWVLLQKVESN